MIEATSSLQSLGSSAIDGATRSVARSERVSATTAGDGASFASVLGQIGAEFSQTLKAGEAAAVAGIEGKANVQQVVEAVMSAERSLQTVIAVRDKIVTAFQDVTRMAI